MCEIILLFLLGKKIAGMASEKGRAGWPWVLMLIGLWIGGEFTGAVIGAILTDAGGGNQAGQDDNMFAILGFALAGAACGAIITFTIVSLLPPVESYDDEDDYPRRRRRRRYDEDDSDDYDDRPRRRRSDEEDVFDEQGLRRRRVDEDDYGDRRRRRYDD